MLLTLSQGMSGMSLSVHEMVVDAGLLWLQRTSCGLSVVTSQWSLHSGHFTVVTSQWSLHSGHFTVVTSQWSLHSGILQNESNLNVPQI